LRRVRAVRIASEGTASKDGAELESATGAGAHPLCRPRGLRLIHELEGDQLRPDVAGSVVSSYRAQVL
jgi:hypothetical protein